MDPDFVLVIGLGLLLLSIPSVLSALSESRPPRVSLIVIVAGGGMLLYAMMNKPGGYTAQSMAEAVYRVIGALVG